MGKRGARFNQGLPHRQLDFVEQGHQSNPVGLWQTSQQLVAWTDGGHDHPVTTGMRVGEPIVWIGLR
jgi:hypothetical protein